MNNKTTLEEPRLCGSSPDKVASGVAATKLRGSSLPVERLQLAVPQLGIVVEPRVCSNWST